jgi:ubiquinone/menaquinone biosynthesis C-methylase UbiE
MLIRIAALVVPAIAIAAAVVAWRFAIFVLPFSWTGESDRLAELLRVAPGQTLADVGAGDGALAADMALRVGAAGAVYATEISPDRRQAIATRLATQEIHNVRIVDAEADATHLPDDCCDAVYLRTVFHHIGDKPAFARALAKAVRAGGRLAIIDFAPGALWFHGADHGVSTATVTDACRRAGLRLVQHSTSWGGGTYLLLFERS